MKPRKFKKIFIVDDDPFWTGMLYEMLTGLGHHNVVTLTSGHDLINNMYQNPCLIFLDYQMENMDGLEVLKKVKENNSDLGVIFCTSVEDLNVAVDAMEYGSFDYLLKKNATRKGLATLLESYSYSV